MKILILGDVHGRDFWREPCTHIRDFDKVIFLGDYLDHYGEESTLKYDIETLKDIITFKKAFYDKVILLIGNHDCPYIWPDTYGKALGDYWCRHDVINHDEIHKIFNNNLDLFQIAWECPYKDTKALFTHAGVNKYFKEICGIDAEQINTFFLEESTEGISNVTGLAACSYYRGGIYPLGSPVWSDIREPKITDVYQIFGHTQLKDAIILGNWACLDCREAFVLDTEKGEITKYKVSKEQ